MSDEKEWPTWDIPDKPIFTPEGFKRFNEKCQADFEEFLIWQKINKLLGIKET